MPRSPDDTLWLQLQAIEVEIAAVHERLRRDVADATSALTALHRRGDELREQLGVHEVEVDTSEPGEPHLRAVK